MFDRFFFQASTETSALVEDNLSLNNLENNYQQMTNNTPVLIVFVSLFFLLCGAILGISKAFKKFKYQDILFIGFSLFGLCFACIYSIMALNPKKTELNSAKLSTQSIKELLNSRQDIQDNLNYLSTNFQLVRNSLSETKTAIQNTINSNITLTNYMSEISDNNIIKRVALNSSNPVTSEDIKAIQQNYSNIQMERVVTHIKNVNNGSSSFASYLINIQSFSANIDLIISNILRMNTGTLTLNDCLTFINQLKQSISNLGYTQNNIDDFFLFFENKVAALYSEQNKKINAIVQEISSNLCTDVTNVSHLNSIASFLLSFVGPSLAFQFVNFSDSPQTFQSQMDFSNYMTNKRIIYDSLVNQFQILLNSLSGFFDLSNLSPLGAQNSLLDILNLTYTSLSVDFGMRSTSITFFQEIQDMINSVNERFTQISNISNTWQMSDIDDIILLFNKISSFSNSINSNFGISSLSQAGTFANQTILQFRSLNAQHNRYNLIPMTINNLNLTSFLSQVYTSYTTLINKYQLLDNSATTINTFQTSFNNAIEEIIQMPNPDGVLTTSKTDITNYINNLKSYLCENYRDLMESIDMLVKQSLDFNGSSDWYTASSMRIKNNNIVGNIDTFQLIIPLRMINFTLESDVLNFQNNYKNLDFVIFTRFINNLYQVIPIITIEQMLEILSSKSRSYNVQITNFYNILTRNFIFNQWILDRMDKVFNNVINFSFIIPTIRFVNYFLIFPNVNNTYYGILTRSQITIDDIRNIIQNIPSSMSDPNISMPS